MSQAVTGERELARIPRQVDLAIGGMTCATCAGRVERKLNRLDGVHATVNFATETARVSFDDTVVVADLVAAVEATGYTATPPAPADVDGPASDADAADAAGEASLRRRLLVSAVLTAPVLVLAMVPAAQFRFWQWLALVLATPVIVWGAWPFHRAAWVNARHGAATMDTLISLGAAVSLVWSLYALFFGSAGQAGMRMSLHLLAPRGTAAGQDIYLEVGATLTTFLLAGRFFEARAKHRAGSALRTLLDLGAKSATVLRDGRELAVPIGQVTVGDVVVVRPGEKIATDGVVVDGASAVDASTITGESVPVEVAVGAPVLGGTVNTYGRLRIRATRVGADTQLAQMGRLVADAQSGKAAVARLADRVAAVFVPVVIAAAIGVYLTWWALGLGTAAAISAAVAVLIVACPCALGLATPTALLVGTGRGAQLGILIKGPQVLESTRRIDTVVLDKTGTVTTGQISVATIVPAAGTDPALLLRYAGALEHASEHPIAKAITAAARSADADLPEVADFTALPGRGATGHVDGHLVIVGRPRLLSDHGIATTPALDAAVDQAAAAGRTAVALAWDGRAHGVIVVADTVKPDAAAAISRLRALGLHPILLTGDTLPTATAVAGQVGVDEVIAEVLPTEKAAMIRQLQRDGRTVAMIGDGVNDAAALATADLGIAMGTGTDAAIEAADLTLLGGHLTHAPDAIRLARATLRTIRGNLFWAFAYNIAAIPLAAAGVVTPVLAAAAMALSSLFVVSNSLRLFRFRAG